MQAASVAVDIRCGPEAAFDLLHDYDRRLAWDPFLREARLLDDAVCADVGVSSRCVARWAVGGMGMDTVYVSFRRPDVAAVKMTRGPAFLASFAASLRQRGRKSDDGDDVTEVTYRYHFAVRPAGRVGAPLRAVMEPVVEAVFRHETARRLQALKAFLERR